MATARNVQAHAANNGYADAVSIHPITFDPQRDTADRLGAYAGEMNVDADAPNWQFLRPESKARAKAVVQEEFGVRFERTHPEDMEMYMFAHTSLTLLVNADGYVERAYRSKSPDEQRIIDDLREVRTA
jgi:protein SCO1/2